MPCEAQGQVKKQQIKVKFCIWGPRTVYYNMPCAQNNIFKSLHPIEEVLWLGDLVAEEV